MLGHRFAGVAVAALFAVALPASGWTADDENSRLREMLHRTQEALHQAQADKADLNRAKLDAEQKLQDTSKQLEGAKGSSRAAQASKASLRTQLDAAHNAQDSLQHNLDDANNRLAVTTSKLGEMFKQLAARETELEDAKQLLEQVRAANTLCEAKNVALYRYSQELLQRYKAKGVWASLSQKDPVLGLGEVDVQNVVQEYQLKMEDQKVTPSKPGTGP